MGVLKQREGVNLVSVLGGIIRSRTDQPVRQKDVVAATSLTKGAVSQNIQKLKKHNLVLEEKEGYKINNTELLELYRTHIEEYCRRRSLPDELSKINEVRSAMKHKINAIINESGDVIRQVIYNILETARMEQNVNTMRDVFHRTDMVLSGLAEVVKEESLRQHLQLIAVSMDRTTDLIKDIDTSYDLTQLATVETAERLLEEIENE